MAAGSADQLEERLKAAQADKQHAEGQEASGQRVLTRTINEKNKLQDANIKQAEELKDIRAQLSDALKENHRLKGDIFSMSLDLPLHSSARKETVNNYVCRYIDTPSQRGGVRIIERSATRAVANARARSAGHAEYCHGLMAIQLPSRKYEGACTTV